VFGPATAGSAESSGELHQVKTGVRRKKYPIYDAITSGRGPLFSSSLCSQEPASGSISIDFRNGSV
jgi:hypothetical protein